jgi:hypothetical protein
MMGDQKLRLWGLLLVHRHFSRELCCCSLGGLVFILSWLLCRLLGYLLPVDGCDVHADVNGKYKARERERRVKEE